MNVRVNGAQRSLVDGATVVTLLDELGLGVGWVVVERNGEALLHSDLPGTVLVDGDVIEIVRAVAGG